MPRSKNSQDSIAIMMWEEYWQYIVYTESRWQYTTWGKAILELLYKLGRKPNTAREALFEAQLQQALLGSEAWIVPGKVIKRLGTCYVIDVHVTENAEAQLHDVNTRILAIIRDFCHPNPIFH